MDDGTPEGTRHAKLPQGSLAYREMGSGEPLVFVHGLLVNSRLWDPVAARLREDFRCILPDMPLGSHSTPMDPDADLSPPGMAQLVVDFLERLAPEIHLERLFGLAPDAELVAPRWGKTKPEIQYDIEQALVRRNTYQGRLHVSSRESSRNQRSGT